MATYTTRSTFIVTLLVGALVTPLLPDTGATAATRPRFTAPAKTVEAPQPIFAGEADRTAYTWAEEVFSAAGFGVPVAAAEFHRSEEACGGARGRAYLSDENLATIVVCASHTNPEVQATWRQRTLLHELAHVWVDQNVDDENLVAFTELRGLEEWSSREVKWEDRATEHAAEILMWGMQHGDYEVDYRFENTSCDSMSAGYALLTGVTINCEAEAA